MSKGATIQDVTKRAVTIRLPLDVAALIMRKFANPGDAGESQAIIRALTESCKGQTLTKDDYVAIEAEMQKNRETNERRREAFAKKNRPSSIVSPMISRYTPYKT